MNDCIKMIGYNQFMICGGGRFWSGFYEHSDKFSCCVGGARLEQLIQCYIVMRDSASQSQVTWYGYVNTLNAELNSICHLLTLLEAHHIFHFSRIRFKTAFYQAIKRHSKTFAKFYFPTEFYLRNQFCWGIKCCRMLSISRRFQWQRCVCLEGLSSWTV
jgi:hypothetical protein